MKTPITTLIRPRKSALLSLGIISFFCASVNAVTVTENFEYPLGNATALAGNANGGTGWDGAWQGNANILYNSTTNLTSENYPLEQDAGSLYSSTANYRAIYRDLASDMSGELWFSYIFRIGGTTGAGGLLFNATSDNATGSPTNWNILRAPTGELNVTINGVTTNLNQPTSNGTDYLILGRMVTGSEGAFELWLNPDLTSVTSLSEFRSSSQPATFTNLLAINPDSISSLGVAAYYAGGSGSRVFRFDALQLSDGNGDPNAAFIAVTAVPEPKMLSLAILSVLFFMIGRRFFTRRFTTEQC